MRLSSGPEQIFITNRPVIVTQSDLVASSALQDRGSPYSRDVRRAAAHRVIKHGGSRRVRTTAVLGVVMCSPYLLPLI